MGKVGAQLGGVISHHLGRVGIRVYFLEDLDENVISCPWNVNNLKRYYY